MRIMSYEELQLAAQKIALTGARVKITGMWSWAEYPAKPSDEIRSTLKSEGWRWSSNKAQWYLAGRPSMSRTSHSYSYIIEKYGEETVEVTV